VQEPNEVIKYPGKQTEQEEPSPSWQSEQDETEQKVQRVEDERPETLDHVPTLQLTQDDEEMAPDI
jgi:hypothetical protein